jgi:lipopolysaccharide biosynthesis protein
MGHEDAASFKEVSHRCNCRACENHRKYQQMHPEKHNEHVKAYYSRNQERILLQKAYRRYLAGNTKRFHKQTLIRLKNAGFDVSASRTAISDLDHVGVTSQPLSAFTGIEVS